MMSMGNNKIDVHIIENPARWRARRLKEMYISSQRMNKKKKNKPKAYRIKLIFCQNGNNEMHQEFSILFVFENWSPSRRRSTKATIW